VRWSNDRLRRLRPMAHSLTWVLLLSVTGCAGVGRVKSAALAAGASRTFTADYDKAVTAARDAVLQVGLKLDDMTKMDSETWTIIGKKGGFFETPELVRVVVQKTSPTQVTVRVLARRGDTTMSRETDRWSAPILVTTELKLKGTS